MPNQSKENITTYNIWFKISPVTHAIIRNVLAPLLTALLLHHNWPGDEEKPWLREPWSADADLCANDIRSTIVFMCSFHLVIRSFLSVMHSFNLLVLPLHSVVLSFHSVTRSCHSVTCFFPFGYRLFLFQFVVFNLLSYCIKETIDFDK